MPKIVVAVLLVIAAFALLSLFSGVTIRELMARRKRNFLLLAVAAWIYRRIDFCPYCGVSLDQPHLGET
jgi:hypothetical protein